MNLRVDEHTIKSTTECNKKFSCLHGDEHPICKVNLSVNEEVVFINCMNDEYCSYQMVFGYLFVCNCPVRNEIYNRYQY